MGPFGASAALAGIGAGLNMLTGGLSARKQFKYTSQLMDKQNQQQIEFWNMNNEYNTPQAQRTRLEEAGLNPDLMYGQTQATNTAQMPTAANGSAPNVDYGRGPDLLGAYRASMDMQMMNAQVTKIQKENALLDERRRMEEISRQVEAELLAKSRTENRYLGDYLEYRNSKVKEDSEGSRLGNLLHRLDAESYRDRFDLEKQRVMNETGRLLVQISQLGLNEKKVQADIRKIDMEISNIVAQNKRLSADERVLLQEEIKAKALNEYYYLKGQIPQGNVGQFLARLGFSLLPSFGKGRDDGSWSGAANTYKGHTYRVDTLPGYDY